MNPFLCQVSSNDAMEIGKHFKDALMLGRESQLNFELHQDTMSKTGSGVRATLHLR